MYIKQPSGLLVAGSILGLANNMSTCCELNDILHKLEQCGYCGEDDENHYQAFMLQVC